MDARNRVTAIRCIQEFLSERKSRNVSPATQTYYARYLQAFADYLSRSAIIHFDEITPDVVRGFLLYLGKDHNPGGVALQYRAVRAFLNWQSEEDGVLSPMRRVPPPKVNTQARPGIPVHDIEKMVDAAQTQRDKALLLCLFDSGCRATEFLAWRVEDVNLATGQVNILQAKGSKKRVVFLGVRARRALKGYLRSRDLYPRSPIWATADEERLTTSGLRQLLRRLARAAELDKLPGPHDFRRACLVSLLRQGVPMEMIARIAGHSNFEVLRRYLYLVVDDLESMIRRASPVDNLL